MLKSPTSIQEWKVDTTILSKIGLKGYYLKVLIKQKNCQPKNSTRSCSIQQLNSSKAATSFYPHVQPAAKLSVHPQEVFIE